MKKHNKSHILSNLVLYSLTSLVTCFFFSYQFLFLSIKSLWFSLPNISVCNNFFPLDAKLLFIVANIIIIFLLVKESKAPRSSISYSSSLDIYDEYIERSRISSFRGLPKVITSPNFVADEKTEKKTEEKKQYGSVKEMRVCNSLNHMTKQRKKGMRASKSEVWSQNGSEIVQREEIIITKEKKIGDVEDLNKRVEAFIERVNNQRLLEAKLVDRGRG